MLEKSEVIFKNVIFLQKILVLKPFLTNMERPNNGGGFWPFFHYDENQSHSPAKISDRSPADNWNSARQQLSS